MKILIAAGGTGGHVYPALALAEVLRERGHEVVFAGGRRIEARLVPEAGFELHDLGARGLVRGISPRALVSGAALARSVVRARRLVLRLGVDVVVGMGGHHSVAPVVAGGRAGRAVVLHEQNAVLSLAHRMSMRWAGALALAMPLRDGPPYRSGVRVEVTGNPLRPRVRSLAEADDAESARRRAAGAAELGLEPGRVTVLAWGGSLGARAVNEGFPRAVGGWPRRAETQILHIAGPDHEHAVRAAWSELDVPAVVLPYLEAVEHALAVADVVVARSGGSVAELTAVGLPAVLVPLPIAPGGHQEANARVLEAAGAARVVLESSPTFVDDLRDAIAGLVSDDGARAAMASASRALGRPDAADRLADLVCSPR